MGSVDLSFVDVGSFPSDPLAGVKTLFFEFFDVTRLSCVGAFFGIADDSGRVCASCFEMVEGFTFPRFSTRGEAFRTSGTSVSLAAGTSIAFLSCVGASVSGVTDGVRLSSVVSPFVGMLDDFPVMELCSRISDKPLSSRIVVF